MGISSAAAITLISLYLASAWLVLIPAVLFYLHKFYHLRCLLPMQKRKTVLVFTICIAGLT